tara:strand:- start:703 stop:1869 length:1167 start_codon:yes stop_codon:yes gene_type:complete
MFNYNLPTKIYVDNQVINTLPNLINKKSENILLITSEEIIDYSKKITDILTQAGLKVTLMLSEKGEPSCNFIDKSSARFKSSNFQYIIGLGGGSAIDLAKAMSIGIKNSEPIWNYANLSNRPPSNILSKPIPTIAIPTTSGTGSEVTPYAVLGKTDTKQKGTIQDSSIFPEIALIDPSFHVSLPPNLTATTGIDAFAHAFESFINISKKSPVSEWAAAESIRLIFKNLYIAFSNPNDLKARIGMAWASTLAGIAIAHRGTTTPHAIAEPMGAMFKIPHAQIVTICTLPVLRYTKEIIKDKLQYLNSILLFDKSYQNKDLNEEFYIKLENLISNLGINVCLKDISNNLEINIDLICENVLQYKFRPLKQHPVEFNDSQLKAIIKEIVYG